MSVRLSLAYITRAVGYCYYGIVFKQIKIMTFTTNVSEETSIVALIYCAQNAT